MELDYLEVSMIQLHGLRLAFTKSETSFLMMVSLYGVTLPTLLKLGVKHHTRSQLYHTFNQLILIPYIYLYKPEKDTPENTTFNYYVSNIHI